MANQKNNHPLSAVAALPEAGVTVAFASLPDTLMSELLLALPPQKLPKKREAQMRKNLMAKIATAVQSTSQNKPANTSAAKNRAPTKLRAKLSVPGITTIRMSDAAASRWHPRAPGIDVKILFDDSRTMTTLVRFAAGARLASHRHHGVEETTVLQGYCYLGAVNLNDETLNMRLNPGDYQLAEDGSTHPEVTSPEGCVLLIRSASLKVSARAMQRI